jgi:hypothetical protein
MSADDMDRAGRMASCWMARGPRCRIPSREPLALGAGLGIRARRIGAPSITQIGLPKGAKVVSVLVSQVVADAPGIIGGAPG